MIKKLGSEKITPKKVSKSAKQARFTNENEIKAMAALDQQALLDKMNLKAFGLENDEFEERLDKFGKNEIKKNGFN